MKYPKDLFSSTFLIEKNEFIKAHGTFLAKRIARDAFIPGI